MLRAVLDANVYVSAVVQPAGPPGRIVQRFLHEAAFEIVLSPAIVEEVFRALAYPKVRRHIRGEIEPELWFEDIMVLADMAAGERGLRLRRPRRRQVHCRGHRGPSRVRRHRRPAVPRPRGV